MHLVISSFVGVLPEVEVELCSEDASGRELPGPQDMTRNDKRGTINFFIIDVLVKMIFKDNVRDGLKPLMWH
jgi:hypothetical protein